MQLSSAPSTLSERTDLHPAGVESGIRLKEKMPVYLLSEEGAKLQVLMGDVGWIGSDEGN